MEENINAPTPEEVDAALSGVEEFEVTDAAVRKAVMKLIPALVQKANSVAKVTAEADYAKRLQTTVDELKVQNQKMIEAKIKEIEDASKPPDPKEIEKLLTQEYMEFKVKVTERKGKAAREFSIRELPQATELKFMKIIEKSLLPYLKELSSVEWTDGMTVAAKLQRLIEIIPSALDMLAECCSISLDPYSDEGITKEWVQANISSFRIMAIIESQVAAGRFRDFFSALFRAIPGQMTS